MRSPPAPATPGAASDLSRASFVLQLVVAFVSVTAIQAARPMVTYRALGLGADVFEIGLVQSSFSIVPVFTAVWIGRFVDRVGEVGVLAAGTLLIGIGAAITALSTSLPYLAVGQLVMGFGQITNLVSSQALMANRGRRERRDERFGWYATIVSLGQLAGPAVAAALVGTTVGAAFTDPSGSGVPGGPGVGGPEQPVFIFSAVAGAVGAGLTLLLADRRTAPARAATPGELPINLARAAARVIRRSGMPQAMLVGITVISTIDILVAYLPAYGHDRGLSVETVGALLSIRAGASLVSRVFMARLIVALGRERLLAASMLMAGLGLGLLPLTSSTVALFGLMTVMGLGLGFGQPMTVAWVASRSPRRERGLALGVRLTGMRISLLVVPTAMGALAGASGISAIWVFLAVFLAIGGIVAWGAPFDETIADAGGSSPGHLPDQSVPAKPMPRDQA